MAFVSHGPGIGIVVMKCTDPNVCTYCKCQTCIVWVKNCMTEFWVLNLGMKTNIVDSVWFQKVLAFSQSMYRFLSKDGTFILGNNTFQTKQKSLIVQSNMPKNHRSFCCFFTVMGSLCMVFFKALFFNWLSFNA